VQVRVELVVRAYGLALLIDAACAKGAGARWGGEWGVEAKASRGHPECCLQAMAWWARPAQGSGRHLLSTDT
jgi:hypothetical protein